MIPLDQDAQGGQGAQGWSGHFSTVTVPPGGRQFMLGTCHLPKKCHKEEGLSRAAAGASQGKPAWQPAQQLREEFTCLVATGPHSTRGLPGLHENRVCSGPGHFGQAASPRPGGFPFPVSTADHSLLSATLHSPPGTVSLRWLHTAVCI